MNCMKCGREIALGQVFCKECLADMADYPVKPDTPVMLPNPQSTASRRSQPARKARKPEDQVKTLRKAVLWLSLSLVAVLLIFTVTVSALLHQIEENKAASLPGQNYNTTEQTTT